MIFQKARRRGAQIARRRGVGKTGRVLAIKWGLNPNSSSLGVDVTFLLFGASVLSLMTPLVSALVRLRGREAAGAYAGATAEGTAGQVPPEEVEKT